MLAYLRVLYIRRAPIAFDRNSMLPSPELEQPANCRRLLHKTLLCCLDIPVRVSMQTMWI